MHTYMPSCIHIYIHTYKQYISIHIKQNPPPRLSAHEKLKNY